MCQICKKVNEEDISVLLEEIGEAMEETTNPKKLVHLSDLLDRVLGIKPQQEDKEMNEAWENSKK